MALLAITHGQSRWQWGRDIDSGYSQALGCGSGVKCCLHPFTCSDNWNPVADTVVGGGRTFRRRDLIGGSGWPSSCLPFLHCFPISAIYYTSTTPEMEDRVLVLAFCGAPCCNGDCRPPWWSVSWLTIKKKREREREVLPLLNRFVRYLVRITRKETNTLPKVHSWRRTALRSDWEVILCPQTELQCPCPGLSHCPWVPQTSSISAQFFSAHRSMYVCMRSHPLGSTLHVLIMTFVFKP